MITTGFAMLAEPGISLDGTKEVIVAIEEIERVRRLADSAAVDLMAVIQNAGLHRADGHGSAKAMVRHHAKLSDGEATARQQTSKLYGTCPDIARAYRAGTLGTCQVRALARTHANVRVRDYMPATQSWFLDKARRDFSTFNLELDQWRRIMDEDGPTPLNERQHDDRNVRLDQNYDTTWDLMGQFAAGQGMELHEVLEHYIRAELLADWEKARAEHGDAATSDDLPRTAQQRRADALVQIFRDASANPNSAMPADFVHHIFWDADTFEEMSNRLLTEGHQPKPLNPQTMICRTLDGLPLDPTEMMASAVVSRIRRVVVDAKGTVIDLGVARFFTGNARHAVMIGSTRCVWPGCRAASSTCEADHMIEHGSGGRTNPGNGAPLCGRHNRWKQKGFAVYRDPAGEWRILRPDGTEIPW